MQGRADFQWPGEKRGVALVTGGAHGGGKWTDFGGVGGSAEFSQDPDVRPPG